MTRPYTGGGVSAAFGTSTDREFGPDDPTATFERLRRYPRVPGSTYKFSASGGFLLAEGVWIKRGTTLDDSGFDPSSIVVAHVECRHYQGEAKCWDAENILTSLHVDALGTIVSSALLNESEITHWSGDRVEAEYRNPVGGLTVRYW